MPSTPPPNPLLIILGPTGTGKSLLSLRLSSLFPLEIINADAMQLYRGLPIITNKLSLSEREGVPHHLLDFIGLDETPWTVQTYVKEVDRVVSQVRGRGKVPILVGGTGYYVYGVLFREGILGEDGENGTQEEDGKDAEGVGAVEEFSVLNASTEEMYAKLMELDPDMAKQWHPNDRRRIQRSLEICLKRGRKVSEIYAEQVMEKNGDEKEQEDGLRYDPLVLWVDAEDAVLKERLNARVDGMVKNGLFDEALELVRAEQDFERNGIEIDKDKGIWVSIGYKEMESWATQALSNPSGTTTDSKLAQDCIEAVKAGTRQYAKRQNRYIRIRLANKLKRVGAIDKLFLLDSSDLDQFDKNVVDQAKELVGAWLSSSTLPSPCELSSLAADIFATIHKQGKKLSYRTSHWCEVCGKTLMTDKEWEGHLASRSHKKMVQRQRRLEIGIEKPRPVDNARPDVDVPS